MSIELKDLTPRSNHFTHTDEELGESASGCGILEETPAMTSVLPDFSLSNSALRNIYYYRAAVGGLFNTLIAGNTITDTTDIIYFYIGKIRALLYRHIWECGGRIA